MLKWINKKRNKKGFTLVELVVVIAILGILGGLAVPRLTGSRDNANRKAVISNLRTIDSAISIAEAEGKLPESVSLANLKDAGYLSKLPQTKTNSVVTSYGIQGTGTSSDPYLANVTVKENPYGVTLSAGTYTSSQLEGTTGW